MSPCLIISAFGDHLLFAFALHDTIHLPSSLTYHNSPTFLSYIHNSLTFLPYITQFTYLSLWHSTIHWPFSLTYHNSLILLSYIPQFTYLSLLHSTIYWPYSLTEHYSLTFLWGEPLYVHLWIDWQTAVCRLRSEFDSLAFLWGEPQRDPGIAALVEWKDDLLYGQVPVTAPPSQSMMHGTPMRMSMRERWVPRKHAGMLHSVVVSCKCVSHACDWGISISNS